MVYNTNVFTKTRMENYMNIQEYDLMNILLQTPYTNQRTLSEQSGYSLGKVNSSLRQLIEKGYLDEEMHFEKKAAAEVERKRPRHAVILAAGFDLRMVPVNTTVPKGLLEVQGRPLVESMICYLHEAGVFKIDIIVGFMKEQYEYLIDKYGVELVYSRDYATRNNLFSLKRVIDRIGNTYIIPCDIWCEKNPFSRQELYSWYMVTDEMTEDTSVRIGRKKELILTGNGEMGNRMVGIAYILEEDAAVLREHVEELTQRREFNQAFWETALVADGKLRLWPREVSGSSVKEINSLEDLRVVNEGKEPLSEQAYCFIEEALSCRREDIGHAISVKNGFLSRVYEFEYSGNKYALRVPEEIMADTFAPEQEYEVYRKLLENDVMTPKCYFSVEPGFCLKELSVGCRTCDRENEEDVRRCMEYLRKFHSKNIQAGHFYDMYKMIDYYESMQYGGKSVYRDYRETKAKICELKEYVDAQPRQYALTHINAIPEKFLMFEDGRICLQDWEYAGMQDVHLDIAMFAVYALYDRERIDRLIDYYFEDKCPKSVRIKIYCYVAIAGFLWSNWCEYKRRFGVEFDEYAMKQYRYAKEFYKIVKKELEDDKDRL